MARELFVYWKVPALHAADAIDATRSMQRALLAAHPGLQAALFRRAENMLSTDAPGAAASVTVMETYRHRSGISAALQETIEAAAARALATLPTHQTAPHPATMETGPRHAEVFDRLPR